MVHTVKEHDEDRAERVSIFEIEVANEVMAEVGPFLQD